MAPDADREIAKAVKAVKSPDSDTVSNWKVAEYVWDQYFEGGNEEFANAFALLWPPTDTPVEKPCAQSFKDVGTAVKLSRKRHAKPKKAATK